MNQLPESIRRESKRLLNLSKESNGILSVKNLSQAQEIVSKIKGAASSFDALVPSPTPNINDLNLAIAIADAMSSEVMMFHRTDSDNALNEIVVYIDTDDFIEFSHTEMTSSENWDPSFEVHGLKKYAIAISFVGYDYNSFGKAIAPFHYILSIAKKLFDFVKENDMSFAFSYIDEGEEDSEFFLSNDIVPGEIYWFSAIFAGQDLPAFKKSSEKEAELILTNTKFCGELIRTKTAKVYSGK